MHKDQAESVLDRLHDVQNRVYQGGDLAELREVLRPDIEWHVPGDNAIAGDYHGLDDVLAYMQRRRELAAATMRMYPRDLLVGDGNQVAVLTDATATISGIDHAWSTVGLYRIDEHRIAACWLLPLDPIAFDGVWATP